MESGAIAYIRQHKALGLGHAVLCAKRLVAPDESVAVILPDDVIKSDVSCLKQMIDVHAETGGSMVATMAVEGADIEKYGVADVVKNGSKAMDVHGLVEKPKLEDAPSDMAVIGRYILGPEIMQLLATTEPGSGNEIQLTDALNASVLAGHKMTAYEFEGTRFDCGSKAGYLRATVAFALDNKDKELAQDLRGYLRELHDQGEI